MYTGLHVNCPLFWSDFNEPLIFSTDYSKNIQTSKFHANSSSGGRAVARGRPAGQTRQS